MSWPILDISYECNDAVSSHSSLVLVTGPLSFLLGQSGKRFVSFIDLSEKLTDGLVDTFYSPFPLFLL